MKKRLPKKGEYRRIIPEKGQHFMADYVAKVKDGIVYLVPMGCDRFIAWLFGTYLKCPLDKFLERYEFAF